MFDAESFQIRLSGYGVEKVRLKLAAGEFGEEKRGIVENWLEQQEAIPVASRPWRGVDPVALYQPSAGDLKYRDAWKSDQLNPFEEAVLLQGVSHAYLSVLVSENSGERSAGFKAMLDAEVIRRGQHLAQRANRIAITALCVAVLAVVISIIVAIVG